MRLALPDGRVIDPTRDVDWRDRNGRRVKAKLRDGRLIMVPRVRSLNDLVVWASGKTNYYISKLLNLFFNATAFSFPATSYFALWTTTLTAASTGSSGTEAAYTSYARVAETNNSTNFSTSSAGSSITNNVAISWPANTGSNETETYLAICDASTAGNMTYFGSITSTIVSTGDTPQINTSGLTVTET